LILRTRKLSESSYNKLVNKIDDFFIDNERNKKSLNDRVNILEKMVTQLLLERYLSSTIVDMIMNY